MAGYNRVLGKSFEGALGQVQRKVVLNHNQRVTRLYRNSLRTLNSWVIDRAIFCREARKIRAKFDKYKGLSADSGFVASLCGRGRGRGRARARARARVCVCMLVGRLHMPCLPWVFCFSELRA